MSDRRDTWASVRVAVVRDAVGIGLATGAYALSFGAISTAAGLSIAQTCVLSLAMFTGASQFALVGVVGTGGAASAGVATAVLLGTRNTLYGVRLAPLLRVSGLRRLGAAQLVIDESTAMATARDDLRAGRVGFWATGLAGFCTARGRRGRDRGSGRPRLDPFVPAGVPVLLAALVAVAAGLRPQEGDG